MEAESEVRRVGFTGTQEGMSQRQKRLLRIELRGATEFHHGDCIGADAEADAIARSMGIAIYIHPPADESKRAFCPDPTPHGRVYPPEPYLERNRVIVNDTDELIAAPRLNQEEVRSGTWSTVRYARQKERPITLLAR